MATSGKDIVFQDFPQLSTLTNITKNKKLDEANKEKIEEDEASDKDDDSENQDDGFLSLTHLEEIIRPTIDKEFKRVKQISNNFSGITQN